jgi:hypothetical protein
MTSPEPKPGLLADLTARVDRIERRLGIAQGREHQVKRFTCPECHAAICEGTCRRCGGCGYIEAHLPLPATPGARVYHREIALPGSSGLNATGTEFLERYARDGMDPPPVEPAPRPEVEGLKPLRLFGVDDAGVYHPPDQSTWQSTLTELDEIRGGVGEGEARTGRPPREAG